MLADANLQVGPRGEGMEVKGKGWMQTWEVQGDCGGNWEAFKLETGPERASATPGEGGAPQAGPWGSETLSG